MDPIKKDINIQIGQRVREVRYSKKLTREQLAEKLDISTLHMGYIEAGHRGMSIATLLKLCLTLGVSADYILLGIDNANTPESSAQMILNTLDKEYRRDLANPDIEADMPKNYYLNDDVNGEIQVKWRSHAYLIFSNWLNYYVYQQTPYNLDEIKKR